jgi:peptidoglycan/LPS O-acetylase OafA/YrhL
MIGRQNNLDFIRTLLALGVLSYHSFQVIGIDYPQMPWVQSFIAISGYVITDSMYRSAGYAHFAWKRLLRIGPAFMVSLVLVAALGGSVIGALSDWIFMGLLPTGANGPLWSLSLEELLYASLALWFALGLYRTERRAAVGLCIIAVVAVITCDFVPLIVAPLLFVTVAFVCGSLLYVLQDRIAWSIPAGLICLGAALWLRNAHLTNMMLYAALSGPPIAYALIILAFHTPPLFARYRSIVGDPSLGIYVFHWPILFWLSDHGVRGLVLYPAVLGSTVLLALLSWHMVEKPALSDRMKSLWLGRRAVLE